MRTCLVVLVQNLIARGVKVAADGRRQRIAFRNRDIAKDNIRKRVRRRTGAASVEREINRRARRFLRP